MKPRLSAIILFLFAFPIPSGAADSVPGEVVVQLKPGTDSGFLVTFGARIVAKSALAPSYRLEFGLGRPMEAFLTMLRADARV
jgi:hypothetical protein